ncbi:hypothetical protein BGZ50_001779 [Haplosporangium sp. Z 11]|nr:hypothetical protein BGZ50_001779 [Haplosporangium sp. Z 11]
MVHFNLFCLVDGEPTSRAIPPPFSLDVDQVMKNWRITPDQFLILKLEFAAVNYSLNPQTAEGSLNDMINNAIEVLYQTLLHKDFWVTVKAE